MKLTLEQLKFRNTVARAMDQLDVNDAEDAGFILSELSHMLGGVIVWQTGGKNPFAEKLLIQTCKDAIEEGVKVGAKMFEETKGGITQ